MNLGAVTCDSDTGDIHRFQRRPALNFGNVSVGLSSFRRRPESMDRLHRLRAWTPASTGVTVRVLHTLAVETDTLPGLPKEWWLQRRYSPTVPLIWDDPGGASANLAKVTRRSHNNTAQEVLSGH